MRKTYQPLFYVFLTAAILLISGNLSAQNTITVSPDDTICPGGTATLTATVTTMPGSYNGTVLSLSDDNWSGLIPIGFNFTFFGNTYSNIVVGSNNILTFDATQAGGYCTWPISGPIPSPSNPMNSIMCPWEDLYPPGGGAEVYATIGTAPNRIFVVSYCSTPMFSCTTTPYTGSVLLYETTNVIEMHTFDKFICSNWNFGYAIHGIQDASGTNAYVVPGRNFPSVWTATNDGYRFTPTGPTTYSQGAIPFAPIILNSPPSAISWYNGNILVGTGTSITVSPSVTTTYVAILGSCSGTASDTVTVVVQSILVDAGPDDTICPGSPVQLNATSANGITGWTWLPTTGLNNPNISNPIASPTVTTTYTVTGTNGNCTTSDDITIVVNNSSLTYTSSQADVDCNTNCNGTASVNVTSMNGPFTYAWTPSGGTGATASNLCAGTYTCVIAAPLGCTSTQTFTITQPPPLTLAADTVPADCDAPNGTATANPSGGTGPYTYAWSDGQTTQTATNLAIGIYGVVVTDANGCTQSHTVSIVQAMPPVAAVTAAPVNIIQGQSTQLTATGGNSYTWSPVTDLSCSNCPNPVATPQQTTTYCVLVIDTSISCRDSACITINVEIPCSSGGLEKLMPNAFSPNDDGVNDKFCIPANVCILHFDLKIFDRWGEMVFETTTMTDCWDGVYKGEVLNTGVYAYFFDAELTTGEKYHQQGNISLVK